MALLSVSQPVLLHFQDGCFKMAVYCPICYDWSIEVADFFPTLCGFIYYRYHVVSIHQVQETLYVLFCS